MKITVCSSMVKLFSIDDCKEIKSGKCLKNESFNFQLYVQSNEDICIPISAQSDVKAKLYEVVKVKGDLYIDKEVDDYYVYAEDHMYPELLKERENVCIKAGESATLFVEIPAEEKSAGEHIIQVQIGEQTVCFPLTVVDAELAETDIYLTNWVHMDGICNYYGVQPFSKEFYAKFKQYLAAYTKMGNNMILVPVFTPPLDTQVGGERLTTQLLKIKKEGNSYEFDFSEVERYIDLCEEYGVKYFEFCHLFTQWGGEFCPKIVATVNGKEEKIFGWETSSESEEYKAFLKAYLTEVTAFAEKKGIKERSVMHLTDEPHAQHIDTYVRLAEFVKQYNGGIQIVDALSNYSFAQRGAVDMPVVCTGSWEFDKFENTERMLYYCVGVDGDCLSNRYFHMPLQRTQVLGFQLYGTQVKGFLHWGFNFYNTRYSLREVNPYEETTAGNEFVAGDSYVVYPGEKSIEYSIRYFALLKGFEDYRLMKSVEEKIGKEQALALLKNEGVEGMHIYPHSVVWHENFREKLYGILEKE